MCCLTHSSTESQSGLLSSSLEPWGASREPKGQDASLYVIHDMHVCTYVCMYVCVCVYTGIDHLRSVAVGPRCPEMLRFIYIQSYKATKHPHLMKQ